MHIQTLQVFFKECLDEAIDADVVFASHTVERDKATAGDDLWYPQDSLFFRLLLEERCRIEYGRRGN
jgi:hypothetical protein